MDTSIYDDWEEMTSRAQIGLTGSKPERPWGTGLVEGAKDLTASAFNQLQEWSQDDPDTLTDDALRWTGSNIQKLGGAMENWQQRNEQGELGLRSAAGGVLRFMNWSSEKGADVGGWAAQKAGVNEELGRFIGSFMPEAIGMKGLGKLSQTAKITKQIRHLRSLNVPDQFIDIATKGKYAMLYSDEVVKTPGKLQDAVTALTVNQKKSLKNLKGVENQLVRTRANNIGKSIRKEFAYDDDFISTFNAKTEDLLNHAKKNNYSLEGIPDGARTIVTPDGKKTFRLEPSGKTGSGKFSWKNQAKTGAELRKKTLGLDDSTLLNQLGSKAEVTKYKGMNKKIRKALENARAKFNAELPKNHPDRITIEHNVDVQHYGRLGKKLESFSGKGADELGNLRMLNYAENSRTGAIARSLDSGDELIKAIKDDVFVDYNKVIKEFKKFKLADKVDKMTPHALEVFGELAIQNPNMNIHDLLVHFVKDL